MINNRYTILNKIGEGRSKVFVCKDKFFPDEKIAVKILQYTANTPEIEAFDNEYKIIKRFSHPGIVSVYDKGTILELDNEYKLKYQISENDKFFTMEMAEGNNPLYCKFLKQEKFLRKFIHKVSLILFYIHQANYIYFDLKPENILVKQEGDDVQVKIIDFGLTKYFPELEDNFQQGTAEYLAPEILEKKEIAFNVDIYSFGILLYQLVYRKLPFAADNELGIFRAHIEKRFEFPSSKFSRKIIRIIQKMLDKNPNSRYISSLEIINDLGTEILFEEKLGLNNSFRFLNRDKIEKRITKYIEKDSWGSVAVVLGDKGSGKSAMLENIARDYNKSVLIKPNDFISASNFWQQFFSRLLYSEPIYRAVDDSLIQYVSLHIDDNSEELPVELKTIVSKIASITDFILLIDDLDKLEVQNFEMLHKLFPILLANQIKIIVSIDSAFEIDLSEEINKKLIELKIFSETEIKMLIDKSYNYFFDKGILKNLFISFSERLPEKILHFNSELIASGIIEFNEGKVSVNYNDTKITKLLSSQSEVFGLLLKNITANELKVLEVLSLFENDISLELISLLIKTEPKELVPIITSLRIKNVLKPGNQNRNPNYINIGFKQFIYGTINNVSERHLAAGKIIVENFPEMDNLIKIRQFELGGDYTSAVKIINETIVHNNINNFPKLKIKLLRKKLSYQLNENDTIDTLLRLSEIYLIVGKYDDAEKTLKQLNSYSLSKYYNSQKERLLGKLFIHKGELDKGIKLLMHAAGNLPKHKDEIYIEVASAYIEQNKYQEADNICNRIIAASGSPTKISGKAENLLGISNYYNTSELNSTLKHFKKAHEIYTQINDFNLIAGSEGNLGNIENMLGNYSKAEKHWNKALQLNRAIGNIEQEASVLMSTGIFYYEHADYEKAVKIYLKAENIFKGLGNKYNFGLINTNLSEVYLTICEYQKSFDAIEKAEKVFKDLQNNDELLEVFFMKSKFYAAVNNKEKLQEVLNKTERLFTFNSEKRELLFRYYKEHLKILITGKIDLNEMVKIKENLYLNNNRLLSAEIQLLLTKEYIKQTKYEEAYTLLNEETLTEVTKFNSTFDAHRYYLLSKIPSKFLDNTSDTKNIYLQKAYSLLQESSITEITLSVLQSLIEFYKERGNRKKVVEFTLIMESVFDYIKSQIKSETILNPLLLYKFNFVSKTIQEIIYLYQ